MRRPVSVWCGRPHASGDKEDQEQRDTLLTDIVQRAADVLRYLTQVKGPACPASATAEQSVAFAASTILLLLLRVGRLVVVTASRTIR